ncbi:MAG: hypothetical protein P1V51_18875 [Deltaproteobacteria bacterium]|nr:hypothetical protein [Deltaproteobacteria bacterium]
MIRCTICGRENEDTFRYCLDCGSEIGGAAAPTQAQPQKPPEPAEDDLGEVIALTEEAPPTGMIEVQSAVVAPLPTPPSVSLATPAGGTPRHTPIPPGPLEATAPSVRSDPAVRAAEAATSVSSPLEEDRPELGPKPVVPPISAPAPAPASRAIPDYLRPCPTCGKEVAAGHAFCGSCGARADTSAAPPPATAASTAAAASVGGTMVMGAVDAPELAAPRFKVTLIKPDGSEAGATSLKTPETVAGSAGAAISIPEDPFVTSAHLTLAERAGVLRVRDGGSATGTFLKLTARQPVPLPSGSALRFGRQRLRLEKIGPIPEPAPGEAAEWGSPDHGARFRLVQELEGGGDGTAWMLSEGEYRVGREVGELTFPKDGYVSGTHGRLQIGADGKASFEDLGSSNGSFLRLTQETVVTEGDFLLVGMHLLRIDLQ